MRIDRNVVQENDLFYFLVTYNEALWSHKLELPPSSAIPQTNMV
jgi:hypothetical protein